MANLTRLSGFCCALVALVFVAGGPANATSGDATKPTCVSDAQAVHSGFASFWTDFRADALKGDYKSLETLVRFPLRYSGVTDSDKKRKIEQGGFAEFFASFLSQDSGQKETSYSVHDFLRDASCVPSGAIDADGVSAQVGPMAFRKSASRWQLTEVFATSD